VKLAVVAQRYGADINGGAELHARYIAERLARHAEVEVVTTCARDYVSWRNELKPGLETVNGVSVRRFPVTRERKPLDFGRRSRQVFEETHSLADELAWLDAEMRKRFGTDFIDSSDANRRQVLDAIAYPKKVNPELRRGSQWFDRFRSNVGAAFFSSAMGWQDLKYMGNVFNPNWNGCPPEATRKLGVSYEEFDASLARSRKA